MRQEDLTPRQKEILQLVWEGLTSREIAEQLHLSVSTVEAHRTMMMKKLRLRNRAELLNMAIQKHIISVDISRRYN